MIIVRHISAPLEDFSKVRDAWLEWRDAHPDQGWRVYNSIDGDQQIVAVERLFADDDLEGPAFHMFGAMQARIDWWMSQPGFQAWWGKWQAVQPMRWARRELWRLNE